MNKKKILPVISEEESNINLIDNNLYDLDNNYTVNSRNNKPFMSEHDKYFSLGMVLHQSYFDGVEEVFWKLDGSLHGPYKSFYSNSKPYIICEYSNGKLNGIYKEFNKYGELILECNYLDGKLHGKYINYHPFFGTKYIECFYFENKLHGLYSKYDDNYNTKYYECTYSNGKKVFNPMRYLLNLINGIFIKNLVDI